MENKIITTKSEKLFSFLALFLFLAIVFYALIKQMSIEPFSVILLLPVCGVLFLFSLFFFRRQDFHSKKQIKYFALILILIMLPFIAINFYNYALKEPSYLISEIISAKKSAQGGGDITNFISHKTIKNIKSQNIEYLKSQGFSVNSQNGQINAFFKGVIKRQKLKISIMIKDDEVLVIAFSGYDAL